MKLVVNVIDGQFCKAQFYISAQEVKNTFNAFENNGIFRGHKENVDINEVYAYIQKTLIISEIIERGYTPLRTVKYFYYNELNRTMPLYGIVFFVIVPDNYSISLPYDIPNRVNVDIMEFELNIKKELVSEGNINGNIGKNLVKLGLYDIVESDAVSSSSTVYYDLVKKVNGKDGKVGKIIEKIDGLVINMDSIDNEATYKQLIGNKVNDIALIVNNDEVHEFHINKIIDKKLYTNEKFNKDKLEGYSFEDLKSLKEALAEAEVFKFKIKTYINYISKYAYESSDFPATPLVFDFYKEQYINKKISDDEIKLKISFEFIEKVIENKISEDEEGIYYSYQSKFLSALTNPLMLFIYTSLLNKEEIYECYTKYLVLKFCVDNNITKGIYI